MQTDLPLEDLKRYHSAQTPPGDLREFWSDTLASARRHAHATQLQPVSSGLTTVEVTNVTFTGFGGEPISAWLKTPKNAVSPLPIIVQYVGYGGGRGLPIEHLTWASAGFAHLIVDTRGQGMWAAANTPDPHGSEPHVPGFMTKGIDAPQTYYYRRVFTDAARAVDVARELPNIDAERTVVMGMSQGGGISLAVAGLIPDLAAVVAHVPFLCDFPRAVSLHGTDPYAEIGRYIANFRGRASQVLDTLRYFDAVNLVREAQAPVRFSVALMDEICLPSTVFAAFNAYAGPKDIDVYPFNGHEGGQAYADMATLNWLRPLTTGESVNIST